MTSVTGLINYTALNFNQYALNYIIPLQQGKLYSGYFLNVGTAQVNPMYIQFGLVDKENKRNIWDDIALNIYDKLIFKNLPLYQIMVIINGPPHTYSYNIIAIDKNDNAIPEITIEPYNFKDKYGAIYVNTGFNPSSWNGMPISEDVTVGTTQVQVDTLTNETVYEMIIKADSANTGIVKIGYNGPSYPLSANQELHLYYVNPTMVNAIASAAGQIIHVIYVW